MGLLSFSYSNISFFIWLSSKSRMRESRPVNLICADEEPWKLLTRRFSTSLEGYSMWSLRTGWSLVKGRNRMKGHTYGRPQSY